jgi:hypothetical protein
LVPGGGSEGRDRGDDVMKTPMKPDKPQGNKFVLIKRSGRWLVCNGSGDDAEVWYYPSMTAAIKDIPEGSEVVIEDPPLH